MGYTENYLNQKKKGSAKNLTTDIITWDTEGQEIVGKVLSVDSFEDSQYSEQCMKYLIETDDGKVSCVLGASRDELLTENDLIGSGIYIRYGGKVPGKNGQTYNKFRIDLFEV